jgi:hypothetical protein
VAFVGTHPYEYMYANPTPIGLSTGRYGECRFSAFVGTHPYEYTYANPTPVSTSEGLSTEKSGEWRFSKSLLAPRRRRERRLPHNA